MAFPLGTRHGQLPFSEVDVGPLERHDLAASQSRLAAQGTTRTRQMQQTKVRNEVDELIEAHLHLVDHVVHQLCTRFPRHVDRDELRGAGAAGLVDAAHRYDPATGVPHQFPPSVVSAKLLVVLSFDAPLANVVDIPQPHDMRRQASHGIFRQRANPQHPAIQPRQQRDHIRFRTGRMNIQVSGGFKPLAGGHAQADQHFAKGGYIEFGFGHIHRTVPRAATCQVTSTSPPRAPTTSSKRLVTVQQWFGMMLTRSPISGLRGQAEKSI